MTDHLEGLRYCPRCDAETLWTNLPDRGETLRCTLREEAKTVGDGWASRTTIREVEGCGFELIQEDTLTVEQVSRMRAYGGRTTPARRTYIFV